MGSGGPNGNTGGGMMNPGGSSSNTSP
jgi:hypothetical protein